MKKRPEKKDVHSCAYFGGLAVLLALGLIDWPIVAALGIGHVLARAKYEAVQEFGEGLEEAL